MRQYELMLVLMPEFPHADEKKRDELLKKLFNEQTMEDISIVDWGKKSLAYEIRKQTEGCYLLITFSSPAFNLAAFEQQIKLEGEQVLRYLLTKKE